MELGTGIRTLAEDARMGASRWIALAEEFVGVDSGPGDLQGAARMCLLLVREWRALGFSVALTDTSPPVVIARRSTEVPGTPGLVMLGHYDTVFPRGTSGARPFKVKDGRASGPGAADMKMGLVTQLAAVSLAGSECRCDLTVVINGDEESGSVMSRRIIEDEARGAAGVFVFEPGEPDGSIVRSRPGVSRFRLEVTGRAAHTGVSPETGINAIEGVAHFVLAVHELGESNRYGTITVSMVKGGTRPNVVPARAEAVVDARVPDAETARDLTVRLREIARDLPITGVRTDITELDSRPPLVATQSSQRLAERLASVSEIQGRAMRVGDARGTSDGNFTAALGVPTVDGLGPPGAELHTDQEWADVDGIFTRAAMIAGYLREPGE